ncbi:MAG: SET domain-containing protein-lysine N-methyltransferase [Candidatus Portnoybacteria bacterium]|nr:SET domain-containing protein-lysine N-methyltransferase [Candidatus Portnoybacteria bacterium]
MLIVKTKLKEIPNKGIGLIAQQKIKKGETVWKYHPVIDIKIMKKNINKDMRPFFEKYACDLGGDYFMFNMDNARFINHSDTPNIKNLSHFKKSIALKDIKKGEEITIDYNTIDVNGVNF